MPTCTCTVDGCDRPRFARAYCAAHYYRLLKHGSVFADVPVNPRRSRWSVDVDEVAVQRAVDGDPPAELNPAERRLAIQELTRTGLSALQIAVRLRCSERTVIRRRAS